VNFLEADSYSSSECLNSSHRLLRLNITCTSFVYTVTDVDSDPPVESPLDSHNGYPKETEKREE